MLHSAILLRAKLRHNLSADDHMDAQVNKIPFVLHSELDEDQCAIRDAVLLFYSNNTHWPTSVHEVSSKDSFNRSIGECTTQKMNGSVGKGEQRNSSLPSGSSGLAFGVHLIDLKMVDAYGRVRQADIKPVRHNTSICAI